MLGVGRSNDPSPEHNLTWATFGRSGRSSSRSRHSAPRWASPRSARWGVWHGEGGEAVQHGLLASAGGVVLGGLLVVLAT